MVVGGWWISTSSRQGCSLDGLTMNCVQFSSRTEKVAVQCKGAGEVSGAGAGAGEGEGAEVGAGAGGLTL